MTHDPGRRSVDESRPLGVLLRRPALVGLVALAAVALTSLTLAGASTLVFSPRVERANAMLSALQDGNGAMLDQETALRGFLATRSPEFLEPYRQGQVDLQRLDGQLADWGSADPALAAQLAGLREAERAWCTGWAEPLLHDQPAMGAAAALSDLLRSGKNLFDSYRAAHARVRASVESRRAAAIRSGQLMTLVGAAVGLAMTAGVAVAVRAAGRRLTGQILPPVRQVRDTLTALTEGELDRRVVPGGPLELRDIADDINLLGAALLDRDQVVAARERDLLAARDEARRAEVAKTAFLATMSHEIRTPLNAVLGLTDLMLATELTTEQRGHLEVVSSSGDSLLALINDILDFSTIESGALDLATSAFDLRRVVHDVAQLFAAQAAGRGLDLLVDLHDQLPAQVMGDAVRLRQIMVNLVANAIKFTAAGHVRISVTGRTEDEGWSCRIAVTDTGIGIAAEQQEWLFRAFTQVDGSITRTYGGTGLGLAISHRIAAAMSGGISVQSEPGAGSTFTVTVRLGAVPAGVAAPDPTSDDGPELSGGPDRAPLRVLLVEDNEVNAELMRLYLARLGHRADHVPNGRDAVETVRGGEYDVVLMDSQMPVMGGVEATAAIRALPRQQPRIIAVTASVFTGDRNAFLTAGADDFLSKPVRLAELDAALSAGSPAVPAAGGRGTALIEQPEPAGPEPLGPGPLDPEAVAELRDLGDEAFEGLYQQYTGNLTTAVIALRAAVTAVVAAGDPGPDQAAVAATAHRLKGSSAVVGAHRIARLCERLEAVGAGPAEDVDERRAEVMTALEREADVVRAAIAALLAG